jgi:hypothetical protein
MRREIILPIAIATLASGLPAPARAQYNGPAYRDRFTIQTTISTPELRSGGRDLRWPGTFVGGAALGIVGAIEGAAYCNNSESGPRSCTGTTIAFAAGGAAVGAIIGHFIGRLFSR